MKDSIQDKVFVIIPAFNESAIIVKTLQDFRSIHNVILMVVDDGSSDHTAVRARPYADIFLKHSTNRGKGAAIKTGMEAAKLCNARYVVTADADGQHRSKDVLAIIQELQNGASDVVFGFRSYQAPMPVLKRFLNRFADLWVWIIYGLYIRDSQSGIRGYTFQAIEKISTISDRYEFDSEVIRETKTHKLRHSQVAVPVRYTEYSMSKLHKQSFANGLRMVIRMFLFY